MTSTPSQRPATRRALVSWCLYDWANSAYPTVILTFVFATYFTQGVAADPITGTAQWGFALTVSGAILALGSPLLGAVADRTGARKPWLATFTVLSVVTTAGLWYVGPSPAFVGLAVVLVVLSNVGFEFGVVFYNAMLPDLVPSSRIGRLSGWGWGIGYAGGLICLIIALFALVKPQTPLFGLVKADAEHVRAAALLTALWFAAFSLPILLWTPDRPARRIGLGRAVREGTRALVNTLRNVRRHRAAAIYLIAQMIYTDGLNTLFAFGGIYAAGTFAMTLEEVLLFGIALNVTAGAGAIAFAWIDDWIGSKKTIAIGLLAVTLLGAAILVIDDKLQFWMLGLALGVFFGPIQSASRSLMAHLSPADMRTEMFGLYALTGKATAFMGPMLFGWATLVSGSQRVGMATVLVFFVTGLALLLRVPDPRPTDE